MLRIELREFRCWELLDVQIPIGRITAIVGRSGGGKTTLLQAIGWCLYGNIRMVNPTHLEKAKTRVVIEMPYNFDGSDGILTINRQKNPGRFILSHAPVGTNLIKTYEDKVAQSIIDDLFGNYDVWMASCYIGQGCRNSFLTAPNTGKMEFLNSIAFHEEDPTVYIERIDAAIADADTDYKVKLRQFTTNLDKFTEMSANIDTSKALTPEQTDEMNNRLRTLLQRLNQLQEERGQRDVKLGMLSNLQQQLVVAQSNTVSIPKPDTELTILLNKFGDQYGLEENIVRISEIIHLLQRRDQLNIEVNNLNTLMLPYVNLDKTRQYTQQNYQEAVAQEVTFRDNQRMAQSLGVLYSEPVIKETIQRNQSVLAAQDRLKLEHEYSTIQMRINMIETEQQQQNTPLNFPDLTPRQISEPDYSGCVTTEFSVELNTLSQQQGAIQAHIQHLQKGRDVLQCPSCKTSLRHQHETLVIADTTPVNIDELTASQQQLNQTIAKIEQLNGTIRSLKMLEKQMRLSYEGAVREEQRRVDMLHVQTRQIELEKQRREIADQNRIKQIFDLKEELKRIADILTILPISQPGMKLLSKAELDYTHSLIAKLSNITIVNPPPISSQQIQSYLTYQELMQRQAVAMTNYSQFLVTIPELFRSESISTLQNYKERMRTYWESVKASMQERSRLEQLVISLQGQITMLQESLGPELNTEITNINNQAKDCAHALTLSTTVNTVLKYHAQITAEREEVIKVNEYLGDLQTFRQYAVDTECHILQQIVDSINASIQGVCGTLFDRDINIALSLFKTMKTTKNVKPVANFSISYQGGTFDNISQLSGGEGDRASLALTLALNRLSSCPLLMLDESLASLDLNMKEAALRTIRENTNNTVLMVIHDGIEGTFDHCINIGELSQGRYQTE